MSEPTNDTSVLIVDDDDTFREVLSDELSRRGYEVITTATGQAGLDLAADSDIDVILLDLRLPDIDGIQVLKRLREREATPGVVVLTGHGTIDTAIRAIQLGAYHYLEKPCPIEEVEITLQKTTEHLHLLKRQKVLEDGYALPDVGKRMVGTSAAFRKLQETVARIAATESTTLILGETGVGKEMVAMLLHDLSPRRERPFVIVDCAALHEELLQSELFGHEKGAFTSATRRRHGLMEVASGGSLFLDEIGEMSLATQSKLLRALEAGRFRRLGGNREIVVDVRVISATNRRLRSAVERGLFREDLFFRLATLTIEIPPLRERKEDITALVEHFSDRFNHRFSLEKRFGPGALETLLAYEWPGNVRELNHIVEQAMVLCDGDVIEAEDLPPFIRAGAARSSAASSQDQPLSLKDCQRRHILSVVESTGGNRAESARLLEISERHLYRLLKKYGWSSSPGPDMHPQD